MTYSICRSLVLCLMVPWAALSTGCQSTVTNPRPENHDSPGTTDNTTSDARMATWVVDTRPAGAACGYPEECETGACSADLTQGSCGICLNISALGEACGDSLDTCRLSATCQNGVCVSGKKVVGEACKVGPKGESNDCDDEDYCVRNEPNGPDNASGTCIARGVLGGACDEIIGCVGTLQCERSLCIPPSIGQNGDSCDERDCAPGLFCGDGMTCRPATLALGADCSSNIGSADCAPGSICESAGDPAQSDGTYLLTCQAVSKLAEPCASSACADGLFCNDPGSDGDFRCYTLLPEGASCEGLFECATGLECRAGVCKSAC